MIYRAGEIGENENHLELVQRIHSEPVIFNTKTDAFTESPLDVLRSRKAIKTAPLADHIARLRRMLYDPQSESADLPGWSYHPQLVRQTMRESPQAFGAEFEDRSNEVSEIVENGCHLLDHIDKIRSAGILGAYEGAPDDGPVWPVAVTGDDGLIQEVFVRARSGANHGRSTKSTGLVGCANPSWLQVVEEFELHGAAAYPIFATGAWLGGLGAGEYADWWQDYISILIYGFYLEYNIDAIGGERHNRLLRDLSCLLEMPDLPAELRARKAHMMCDMAFFDKKRRHEAALRSVPTTGMTAWVFRDRDLWRDFKACDSALFGHYLSLIPGDIGRDDLMLTGLANDWGDLGPDLRNGECAQSVLTLTRGSISTSSLVECYERTVWMINSMLTPEAGIKPDRFPMLSMTMCVSVWDMTNHRHDVWRYYALAVEACAQVLDRDLFQSCQLADCYSKELEPIYPLDSTQMVVPRRPLNYAVTIAGKRYSGQIEIHAAVVDAVENGILPMDAIGYQYIIPRLLFHKNISSSEFMSHMDKYYCENFAILMRAAHNANFSKEFVGALSSLVLEQWWSGMIYAIGVGSMIEAQPGTVANDREHH